MVHPNAKRYAISTESIPYSAYTPEFLLCGPLLTLWRTLTPSVQDSEVRVQTPSNTAVCITAMVTFGYPMIGERGACAEIGDGLPGQRSAVYQVSRTY